METAGVGHLPVTSKMRRGVYRLRLWELILHAKRGESRWYTIRRMACLGIDSGRRKSGGNVALASRGQ